jgi:O-antigen/teichoic acid export membrane protein
LTTEQIGLINLIVSVGLLFAQFANFGTVYTTWKFFPFFKNKEKNHFGFLRLMLLIVLSGIVTCLLFSLFMRKEIEHIYVSKSPLFVNYYYWIIPIGVSTVVFMVLEVYLRSLYKNVISVLANDIILRAILSVLLLLVYFKSISFNVFVSLHSLIYIVPPLILIFYLYKIGELNVRFQQITISKKFQKIIFQFSVFNYFNTLGTVLVNSLDVMMIAYLVGLKATGVYSTIVFFASALQVPYKAIIRISSPLIADYWKHRQFKKMEVLYRKVSSVSLVIGLGSFIVIWNNIDFLFSFLKPEFHEGIGVFLYLMIGRLLDMYFGLNGSIFVTSKKYMYDIFFTVFLIVAVFILNLLLIPKWGISGAAMSTSLALIIYNLMRVVFVYKTFKIHPFTKNQFVIIFLAFVVILTGAITNQLVGVQSLRMVLSLLGVLLFFFLPILLFKLEPETIEYFANGMKYLRRRFERN